MVEYSELSLGLGPYGPGPSVGSDVLFKTTRFCVYAEKRKEGPIDIYCIAALSVFAN